MSLGEPIDVVNCVLSLASEWAWSLMRVKFLWVLGTVYFSGCSID